jgi:hypothetical protein
MSGGKTKAEPLLGTSPDLAIPTAGNDPDAAETNR